jgi:cytochrome c heme-lyase
MSLTWLFGPSRVPTDASAATLPASVDAADAPGCPVDHSTRSKWLSQQNTNASGQPEAPHPFVSSASTPVASTSSSSSTKPLSSQRETSTIPRYLASSPNGPIEETAAEASTSKWVYPSPSQFFTALQRKDRKPRQEDMDTVVTIHNAVNERTWHEVMRWEKEAGEDDVRPQLVTFKGRPNDRSPRAWWKVLLGYVVPVQKYSQCVLSNHFTSQLSSTLRSPRLDCRQERQTDTLCYRFLHWTRRKCSITGRCTSSASFLSRCSTCAG